MRFVDQTIMHDPENGQYGNCMQAAIAGLLNLPLDKVPHFHHDNCDAETFWERVEQFLYAHGYIFMYGHLAEGFYLVTGTTNRGTKHVVIYRDGVLFHDPHPSRSGIEIVTNGIYLVPLDPALR